MSSRLLGAVRHIDEYAEAGARYVSIRQQGAANTQRAYAGNQSRFTSSCREHQRQALPADVLTMAAFITSLAEANKNVATIQRHCASISKANFLNPTSSLRLQGNSPALGQGSTVCVPLNAVGGLLTPTLSQPGTDAGAYQSGNVGNQQ